jgi:hypothetical protein
VVHLHEHGRVPIQVTTRVGAFSRRNAPSFGTDGAPADHARSPRHAGSETASTPTPPRSNTADSESARRRDALVDRRSPPRLLRVRYRSPRLTTGSRSGCGRREGTYSLRRR